MLSSRSRVHRQCLRLRIPGSDHRSPHAYAFTPVQRPLLSGQGQKADAITAWLSRLSSSNHCFLASLFSTGGTAKAVGQEMERTRTGGIGREGKEDICGLTARLGEMEHYLHHTRRVPQKPTHKCGAFTMCVYVGAREDSRE